MKTLTPREIEVLKLILEEMSSAEIAGKLAISLSTVNTHRSHIAEKLGTTSLVAMTKYAIGHGWIAGFSASARHTDFPSNSSQPNPKI